MMDKEGKKKLMTLVAQCVENELVHSPHLTLKDTCKNAGQIEKKFILKSVIDKFKECKNLTSKQQMTLLWRNTELTILHFLKKYAV